jgi:dephospho-CoA kinase
MARGEAARVYYAGPDEVLPPQVNYLWRAQLSSLPDLQPVGKEELERCDAVLAVLPTRRGSPRLAADLAWAASCRRPIVGVKLGAESPDPYLWLRWLSALSDSLGEGVELLYEVLGLRAPAELKVQLAPPVQRRWVGFCGLAGAGKDTAAAVLVRRGWVPLAFADALREVYAQLYPYRLVLADELREAGVKDAVAFPNGLTHRQGLQRLGTEVGRQLDEGVWVAHLQRRAEECVRLGAHSFCVTDVRFENEARFIQEQGGLVICVRRPGLRALAHASERPEGLPVDAVIENDGTVLDLERQVQEVVERRYGALTSFLNMRTAAPMPPVKL